MFYPIYRITNHITYYIDFINIDFINIDFINIDFINIDFINIDFINIDFINIDFDYLLQNRLFLHILLY
ncbi:MAG: pentapeptide repeat-containing protein [Methanosarcina mazei]|nr:pentapeptide repeat-containing protein [Methanosarcina mazei]